MGSARATIGSPACRDQSNRNSDDTSGGCATRRKGRGDSRGNTEKSVLRVQGPLVQIFKEGDMDIPTWLHALGESKIPEGLGGIGEFLTGLAVVSFGILGLRQYREGHKLDAADVLMKTEKEFRRIFRTCNAIEVGSSYSQSIRPLLDKLNKGCDNARSEERR